MQIQAEKGAMPVRKAKQVNDLHSRKGVGFLLCNNNNNNNNNNIYDSASNSATFIRNEANYRSRPLHLPCGVRTRERGSLKNDSSSHARQVEGPQETAHTREDGYCQCCQRPHIHRVLSPLLLLNEACRLTVKSFKYFFFTYNSIFRRIS